MRPDRSPPDADWARLAERIRARRRRLGLTQAEAAELAGISAVLWGRLERASRTSYAAASLAGVARAMRWSPTSIAETLDGGEPSPLVDVGAETVVALDRLNAQLAALAAHLGAPVVIHEDETA